MEYFSYGFEQDGLFIQYIYYIKNNRFYERVIAGGVQKWIKRVSEAKYINAYETFKNF